MWISVVDSTLVATKDISDRRNSVWNSWGIRLHVAVQGNVYDSRTDEWGWKVARGKFTDPGWRVTKKNIYISFEHLEGIYIGGLYGQIYIYCLKRSLGQTWRMKKSKLRSQIELGIISLVEVGGGGSGY